MPQGEIHFCFTRTHARTHPFSSLYCKHMYVFEQTRTEGAVTEKAAPDRRSERLLPCSGVLWQGSFSVCIQSYSFSGQSYSCLHPVPYPSHPSHPSSLPSPGLSPKPSEQSWGPALNGPYFAHRMHILVLWYKNTHAYTNTHAHTHTWSEWNQIKCNSKTHLWAGFGGILHREVLKTLNIWFNSKSKIRRWRLWGKSRMGQEIFI